MRTFLIITLFLLSFSTYATSYQCSKRALKNKDCTLKLGKYSFHFWKDKLFINDKVFRSLYDLPVAAEGTEWVKVKVSPKGKHQLLIDFLAWEKPQEKTRVQNLIFVLYRVKGEKLQKGFTQIIQKRIERKKTKNGRRYLKEPRERYSYKVNKDKVLWTVGKQKGTSKFVLMNSSAQREEALKKAEETRLKKLEKEKQATE